MSFFIEEVMDGQYAILSYEGYVSIQDLENGRLEAKKFLAMNNWDKLLVDLSSASLFVNLAELYYFTIAHRKALA